MPRWKKSEEIKAQFAEGVWPSLPTISLRAVPETFGSFNRSYPTDKEPTMNYPRARKRGAKWPSENKRKNPLPHGYAKQKGALPDCLSRSRSLVFDSCVLFGILRGTTLLVWSVFGNCVGRDPIGVRLGLLMRCVRAFVGDIHHQCDTGMIQTECFVQIFSASSVWGWINYEVVVVAIEAGVRKTLRQTRKKIEAPSCRIRICHGHVLARRLPWSGWITDACGRIWWGCGCMNYL